MCFNWNSHIHTYTASHRVPTDLKSQGESGNWGGPGKVWQFVRCQEKIACVIRLCNCYSSVVVGQKRDELFWIIWIQFLLHGGAYFNADELRCVGMYMCWTFCDLHFDKFCVFSSFVFLRLLCPAILNPKQFNLITGTVFMLVTQPACYLQAPHTTCRRVLFCTASLWVCLVCPNRCLDSVGPLRDDSNYLTVPGAGSLAVPHAAHCLVLAMHCSSLCVFTVTYCKLEMHCTLSLSFEHQ